MAKKRPHTTAQPEKLLTLTIRLEPSDDTPMYYVNYAEVTISQHDFCILGVRVPTRIKSTTMVEGTTLPLEPNFQAVIPPTVIPGLIRALISQKEAYEAKFGPITDVEAKS